MPSDIWGVEPIPGFQLLTPMGKKNFLNLKFHAFRKNVKKKKWQKLLKIQGLFFCTAGVITALASVTIVRWKRAKSYLVSLSYVLWKLFPANGRRSKSRLALSLEQKAASMSENFKTHLHIRSEPSSVTTCSVIDYTFRHSGTGRQQHVFWMDVVPGLSLHCHNWAELLVGTQWLWMCVYLGSGEGLKGIILSPLIWVVTQR